MGGSERLSSASVGASQQGIGWACAISIYEGFGGLRGASQQRISRASSGGFGGHLSSASAGHHRGASGGSSAGHQQGIIGGLRGAHQQGISWASAGHHRGASGGSEQLIIGGLRGALNGASAGVEGALFPYLGAGGREGEREGGC